MKNILLISSVYPTPDSDYDSPVVHYFAKEWKKQGYNVQVIHYKSVFVEFLYLIARIFTKQVAKYIGNNNVDTKKRKYAILYMKDNVNIISMPIFKIFPHGKYSKSNIIMQSKKIVRMMKSMNFKPNAIIGHFYNPQLPIVAELKKYYPEVRTCIVFHENPDILKKTYYKECSLMMRKVDIWGFRSEELRRRFEGIYGYRENMFICYSGVDEKYISNEEKMFFSPISRFCFVGQLIPRKKVDDILIALAVVFPERDFHFDIVGEGMEKLKLEALASSLGIRNNVTFKGKISRDSVNNVLRNSESFIMVSKGEAFGLVYLEAMAQGCITIGARGEGIDGVIIHGVNGFLCKTGNINDLSSIIMHIRNMKKDDLDKISRRAKNTAINMTDKNVARRYIDNVFGK